MFLVSTCKGNASCVKSKIKACETNFYFAFHAQPQAFGCRVGLKALKKLNTQAQPLPYM